MRTMRITRRPLAISLAAVAAVALTTVTVGDSAQAGTSAGDPICITTSNAPVYDYNTGVRKYTVQAGRGFRIHGRVIDGKYAGYYFGHGPYLHPNDGVSSPVHFHGCSV